MSNTHHSGLSAALGCSLTFLVKTLHLNERPQNTCTNWELNHEDPLNMFP